jgi:hypothetical protein
MIYHNLINNNKLYKIWKNKLTIINIKYNNYKKIKNIGENNKIKIIYISTMNNNLFNIKIFKQVN